MSRYANQNPDAWDYMNGQGSTKRPAKQGRRPEGWCSYCQSTEHRSSAWTAGGRDVERFDRLHRPMSSYRADTIEPTEPATSPLLDQVARATGAESCVVCGTLTFGRAHNQAMCATCQDDMAAGA